MVPIVPGQPESSALVTRIGTTDDYCYDITDDSVHVHDLNAIILHLLGIDHERLKHKFQGRRFTAARAISKGAREIVKYALRLNREFFKNNQQPK